MPQVKAPCVAEEHIIRESDVDAMLTLLDNAQRLHAPLVYKHRDKTGVEQTQKITAHYGMAKALLCLLFLFGRRISGILRLKRGDVWCKRGYLYIRFHILKKARLKDALKPKITVKRLSIKASRKYV